MKKKYWILTCYTFLALAQPIQPGYACTQPEIDDTAPTGCSCTALSWCQGAAGVPAAIFWEVLKVAREKKQTTQAAALIDVLSHLESITEVGTLWCMAGGMAHCPNWDTTPQPGKPRVCGLKFCGSIALKVRKLYNSMDKNFWNSMVKTVDTDIEIKKSTNPSDIQHEKDSDELHDEHSDMKK